MATELITKFSTRMPQTHLSSTEQTLTFKFDIQNTDRKG